MKKGLYLNISPHKVREQREKTSIAAIGVTPEGFKSLELFLNHMPIEKNITLVVVQHVVNGKGIDPEMLQPHTRMNVLKADDKTEVLPGNIYILPHDRHCWFFKGKIHFFEINHSRGYYPIDIFFRSLADQLKRNAAAVLLASGTSDGISGLKYLVGHQGVGLAEQTDVKLPVSFEKTPITTLPELLMRKLSMKSQLKNNYNIERKSAIDLFFARREDMVGVKFNHSFGIQHI
jgi:two-component system, chemotaxis family, CheB/CheR fusion protein